VFWVHTRSDGFILLEKVAELIDTRSLQKLEISSGNWRRAYTCIVNIKYVTCNWDMKVHTGPILARGDGPTSRRFSVPVLHAPS
jgi:hypothetical protein